MMGTKRQKMDYAGLRRRETYEEIINYLENEQEIIKYPDRRAKFLRDSPYLTQLDGEGIRTLEEQETGAIRQRAKDDMLRELGYKADGTVAGLKEQQLLKLELLHLVPLTELQVLLPLMMTLIYLVIILNLALFKSQGLELQ